MARTNELPPEGGPNGSDNHGTEVSEDGASLMLCSPLIPQRDSLVEIADTEYVYYNEAGRAVVESHRSPLYQAHTVDDIDDEIETDGEERKSEAHQTIVVDDKGEGSSQTAGETSVRNDAAGGEGQSSDVPGTESRSIFRWPWSKTEEKKQVEAKAKEEQRLKKNEKLVWVPSPTKISLQTMWWGYRMSVNFRTCGSTAN